MNRDQLYNRLLNLLQINSPYTHERVVLEQYLPTGGAWDDFGNYHLIVPGDSKTMFACHLDTVGRGVAETYPRYKNGYLHVGNKKGAYCLGGDDRCGILCLTALIDSGVPGYYLFHIGEERGAKGASWIEEHMDLTDFSRAIEFDRRGQDSIITEMMGDPVCSPEFALALAEQIGIGYAPDPTGVFTDVRSYKEIIPEVTNISVGYFNEHSVNETVAVDWLIDVFIPQIIRVDWESLPTVRDPKAISDEEICYWSWLKSSATMGICDWCGAITEVIEQPIMNVRVDCCENCIKQISEFT